jgi:hypothetical protein
MQKIYPQENNIPIYNPSGKYWIKLYNFGKAKLVEIDDKIPFDRYDEILLPKTNIIEELWPVIFSKAIMKLFHYKFQKENYLYEEIGDLHIIYALTGYQGEKIFLRNPHTSLYYNMYSYWSSLKRNNKLRSDQNKKEGEKDKENDKEKDNKKTKDINNKGFSDKDKLNFLKFDENDIYKDKSTNEKLMKIIKNVMDADNHNEKRKFLLNFNTLNLYTKKEVKFNENELHKDNESLFKSSNKVLLRLESSDNFSNLKKKENNASFNNSKIIEKTEKIKKLRASK